ncbi:hypothetical protein J6590_079172 [Homalodisca vitripennis]|nr:hypothetical protein J6590_079172 [Homalodisca vitripennis]
MVSTSHIDGFHNRDYFRRKLETNLTVVLSELAQCTHDGLFLSRVRSTLSRLVINHYYCQTWELFIWDSTVDARSRPYRSNNLFDILQSVPGAGLIDLSDQDSTVHYLFDILQSVPGAGLIDLSEQVSTVQIGSYLLDILQSVPGAGLIDLSDQSVPGAGLIDLSEQTVQYRSQTPSSVPGAGLIDLSEQVSTVAYSESVYPPSVTVFCRVPGQLYLKRLVISHYYCQRIGSYLLDILQSVPGAGLIDLSEQVSTVAYSESVYPPSVTVFCRVPDQLYLISAVSRTVQCSESVYLPSVTAFLSGVPSSLSYNGCLGSYLFDILQSVPGAGLIDLCEQNELVYRTRNQENNMSQTKKPAKLYELCLELLCPVLEKMGGRMDWSKTADPGPLDKLASMVVEDLLVRACRDAKLWNDSWIVFLTPKITAAVLKWDRRVLEYVGAKCKNLRRVLFKWVADSFEPIFLKTLPKSVCSVDFDGELYNKGSGELPDLDHHSWLPESENILKCLRLSRKKLMVLNEKCLVELHLATLSVTADQLTEVLQLAPNLKLLRHYQLVSALYKLHSETWKSGGSLSKYKLANLDADFSHVRRTHYYTSSPKIGNMNSVSVKVLGWAHTGGAFCLRQASRQSDTVSSDSRRYEAPRVMRSLAVRRPIEMQVEVGIRQICGVKMTRDACLRRNAPPVCAQPYEHIIM